jgi:hypothetical protein
MLILKNIHITSRQNGLNRKLTILYRRESILAISHFPQTQHNVVKYYILQFTCKIRNF